MRMLYPMLSVCDNRGWAAQRIQCAMRPVLPSLKRLVTAAPLGSSDDPPPPHTGTPPPSRGPWGSTGAATSPPLVDHRQAAPTAGGSAATAPSGAPADSSLVAAW